MATEENKELFHLEGEDIFLTPEQIKEIEEECGMQADICVPKIIDHVVGVDIEGNPYEYDELNCDSCCETKCMYWMSAHSEEEKEYLEYYEKLSEDIKLEE